MTVVSKADVPLGAECEFELFGETHTGIVVGRDRLGVTIGYGKGSQVWLSWAFVLGLPIGTVPEE